MPGCTGFTGGGASQGGEPLYGPGAPPPPDLHLIAANYTSAGSPGSVDTPGCNGFLFKLGACPSESGAAGTTPQEVKQSAIGAAGIVFGTVLGVLAGSMILGLIGKAAEDTGDSIAAQLQAHADEAAAKFDSGEIGLSPAQARAAAANPGLEATFRGQVIDSAVKDAVGRDPNLASLYITRSGEFGPDFLDLNSVPGTPQWYDVTTENSWLAHAARYADFGEGTGIFYGGG